MRCTNIEAATTPHLRRVPHTGSRGKMPRTVRHVTIGTAVEALKKRGVMAHLTPHPIGPEAHVTRNAAPRRERSIARNRDEVIE